MNYITLVNIFGARMRLKGDTEVIYPPAACKNEDVCVYANMHLSGKESPEDKANLTDHESQLQFVRNF